jgi:hypothetical protein
MAKQDNKQAGQKIDSEIAVDELDAWAIKNLRDNSITSNTQRYNSIFDKFNALRAELSK